MMEHSRSVSRIMHEEHMAVVALLERLERFIAGNRAAPPDTDDPATARLLGALTAAIQGEIKNHFAFEEAEIFPRLDEGGPSGMTSILMEEHGVIAPAGERIAEIARAARTDGFSEASWREFCQTGLDFAERLTSHIDKEEMGLIAAIESVLDEETDLALTSSYAGSR
ncbi:MAG TPA: hemerythrin domain-containing protein [Alphaproteobacteria bacterium]|nr:hemerythrin domain-containing protein [Alphaproteobacteria bacterium]